MSGQAEKTAKDLRKQRRRASGNKKERGGDFEIDQKPTLAK